MKKVLLAVFLLCGFSLTAQAACPVFGPSEDPCSGPVFGPSTCECPWGWGGGGRGAAPPLPDGSLEVACFNSPFPAPPYFSRSSIVASNVATKSASVDNSYIQ